MFTREAVLESLRINRSELEKMGVRSLRLFGSVARNEATDKSDLDVLVDFYETPSLFELIAVQHFLEDLFDRTVDVGLEQSLREHVREPVLEDVIYAF